MSNRRVIVDGYSVMHAWKLAGRSLERKRDALVRVLRQYADQSGRKVTVVFDGYAAKRKPEVTEPVHGVEVLFSEKGKTADDVIERLVAAGEHRDRMIVVSSDNMVRRTVESMGAQSTSAEAFEIEVGDTLRELERAVRHHGKRRKIGTLGDSLQR